MNPTQRIPSVTHFVRAALGPDPNGPTDAELLARFAATREEGAFELLVSRHSSMVLRTCRAILSDHHAAEDATQAAFLALAKQAGSVGHRGTVAGWLYRVARGISVRVATRPKLPVAAVPNLDSISAVVPSRDPLGDLETVQLLHQELERLPDRYRVPLLLCYFEGLTHTDAARQLGWPIGTVATRVARAKERLHRKLVRRGVAIPAAGLAALFAADAAAATPALVYSTMHSAGAFAAGAPIIGVSSTVLELAKGAIQTMAIKKVQWAAGIFVLCGALTLGGGLAVGQRPGGGGGPLDGTTNKPAPNDSKAEPTVERNADSAQRKRSLNNLKLIALAINKYHEANNGYLPADVRDKDGKPLLSWRVLLLPYLEQDALFRQFKLNEPWDSEHNLKLLAKMPDVFRVGFEGKISTHTYYQAFAGPGTPLYPYAGIWANPDRNSAGGTAAAAVGPGSPGDSKVPALRGGSGMLPGMPGAGTAVVQKNLFSQITDGTSNTFGVIEAGPPVPWSKPADILYDPKKPLPKLVGPFANCLNVSMMDGTAHALQRNIAESVLRTFIGMNDGEIVPPLNLLRAPTPAETLEEKAQLKKQIDENQRLIDEIDRLMQDHVALMALQNKHTNDVGESENQHEHLKTMLDSIKARNKKIRDELGLRGGAPIPKE